MAVKALNEQEARRPLKLTVLDNASEQADLPFDRDLAPPERRQKPERKIVRVDFPTEQMVAVLGLLMKVLAARIILMLAGFGAFALSLIAIQAGTVQALVAAGLYAATVFAPCIYFALRRE